MVTNNDDDHNDEHNTETYSEPCHKSKMESFAKIVNGLKVLAIFAKRFILDIWQGFEYVFVIFYSYSFYMKTYTQSEFNECRI